MDINRGKITIGGLLSQSSSVVLLTVLVCFQKLSTVLEAKLIFLLHYCQYSSFWKVDISENREKVPGKPLSYYDMAILKFQFNLALRPKIWNFGSKTLQDGPSMSHYQKITPRIVNLSRNRQTSSRNTAKVLWHSNHSIAIWPQIMFRN